jgi:hypothetical protein
LAGPLYEESTVAEKTWQDEYLAMIRDCEENDSKLTDWERNFLDSVSDALSKGYTLSTKRLDVLNTIWEKVNK